MLLCKVLFLLTEGFLYDYPGSFGLRVVLTLLLTGSSPKEYLSGSTEFTRLIYRTLSSLGFFVDSFVALILL